MILIKFACLIITRHLCVSVSFRIVVCGQTMLDAVVPIYAKPFNFPQEYGLNDADVSNYFHFVSFKVIYLVCI